MIFSRSNALSRAAAILSAGLLASYTLLASTLPGPTPAEPEDTIDAAPSTLLPAMIDSSASFTDTGDASPAPAPPMGGLDATVASSELAVSASLEGASAHPDSCMPEPVSMVLMTSGLLGLIVARRFKSGAYAPRRLKPALHKNVTVRSSSRPETCGSRSR